MVRAYHLNRIDQPIEQPFLQWGNPLQLVMDQRPVNMAQPASRKGHLFRPKHLPI